MLDNKVKMIIRFTLILVMTIQAQALTWEESKKLLKEKNFDYASAVTSLEQTEHSQTEMLSTFYPQFEFLVKQKQTKDTGYDLEKYYSAGFVLSQNLFNGGKDYYSYQSSKHKYTAEQQSFRLQKIKLQSELKRQLAQLEFTKKSVSLSEAIVVRRRENYQSVMLRYGTGYEDKAAVVLSEAYLDDSKLDIEVSKTELDQADKSIKQFLGLNLSDKIEWTGIIPQSNLNVIDDNKSSDVDAKIHELEKSHPLIIKIQEEEKTAYFDSKEQFAGFMPSLDLEAKYTEYDSQPQLEQNQWYVGLTLTIPLFSGFSQVAKSKSADAGYQLALKKTFNQSTQIVNQVLKTYSNLKLAKGRVIVAEKYLKAAKLRAEVMHEKYNLGLVWFDRWDTAETNLISREKDYLQAQRDLVVGLADFEEAIAFDEEL